MRRSNWRQFKLAQIFIYDTTMNALRITLFILGVLIIAGIYVYQKKQIKRRKSRSISENLRLIDISNSISETTQSIRNMVQGFLHREPDIVHRNIEELDDSALDDMKHMVAENHATTELDDMEPVSVHDEQQAKVAPGEELIVVITVIPKPDQYFDGASILQACEYAGMKLGERHIFHRYAIVHGKVVLIPVCSLANMYEPGNFNEYEMQSFSTNGMVLFLQLPGPIDGREAFRVLIDVADKLSEKLDALICDESRNVLTAQAIGHLKEKIENYRFKLRMKSLKQKA